MRMLRSLIFVFLTTLIGVSCKKSDSADWPSYYFKGKVNGLDINWVSPHLPYNSSQQSRFWTASAEPGGSMMLPNCNAGDSLYQYFIGTTIFEKHDWALDFSNSVNVDFARSGTSIWHYGYMRDLFTNGIKSFGFLRENCSDPIIDGIIISFTDANNKTWTSSIIDPSSNFFEQIELVNNPGDGYYQKEWKARFSCRLYDDLGNYIIADNCEIYGPVFPV